MKHITVLTVALLLAVTANSQNYHSQSDDNSRFSLSAAISAGTTGVGLSLEMPVSEWLGVRAGFDWMPHFEKTFNFRVSAGDDYADEQAQQEKFQRLSDKLKNLTGMEVDRYVDMIGTPSFYNFNFLLDLYPFENRNWHITAGFYWGSSTIASAENAAYDANALVSVNIYNDLYERVIYSYENFEPFIEYGGEQLYAGQSLYDSFTSWGRMGMPVGDSISSGNKYFMFPDGNSMVTADMNVNSFKPYVGFGYSGPLFKGSDLYRISFDCGALVWGGTPSVITHEGVDIVHELKHLNGQIKPYVDAARCLPVYPVIKVSLSRRLF